MASNPRPRGGAAGASPALCFVRRIQRWGGAAGSLPRARVDTPSDGDVHAGFGAKYWSRHALSLASIIDSGGMPNTSTSFRIWSSWSAPLNNGSPVCISTRMQPSDQTSMATVYGSPSMTSGDR